MAKHPISPSAQFVPHAPSVTGPDTWAVHFCHGATSAQIWDTNQVLEMLAKGWEPFALDQGVLALRIRRPA